MYYKLELINRSDRSKVEEIYEGNKLIKPGTQDLFWAMELDAECESYSLSRIMYVKTILDENNINSIILSYK